jgi:hypothetical protein
LVFRPNRKRLIGVKWIYKEKKNVKEEVERYKAKLVTKAIVKSMRLTMMRFLLLSRLETIRLIIVIVAQHGWRIYQIDVKSTFLNDFLEEKVYIE